MTQQVLTPHPIMMSTCEFGQGPRGCRPVQADGRPGGQGGRCRVAVEAPRGVGRDKEGATE